MENGKPPNIFECQMRLFVKWWDNVQIVINPGKKIYS